MASKDSKRRSNKDGQESSTPRGTVLDKREINSQVKEIQPLEEKVHFELDQELNHQEQDFNQQGGSSPELVEPRRSTRIRREPERFTFDKANGYMARAIQYLFPGIVKEKRVRFMDTVAKTARNTMIRKFQNQPTNLNYICALLLDSDSGMIDAMMPHVINECGHLFKAKRSDPDTPNIREALSGEHAEHFMEAMKSELSELESHETWEVVPITKLPEGRKLIPGTWAFKIKRFPDGRLRKYKARFCVRGDRQVEGVDYHDKYAPVAQWSTIRMLLTLGINEGWKTKQVDFSNAFVQAHLNEEVYISLPSMYSEIKGIDIDRSKHIMKLNRSLYGLVQAPLYWYNHLKQSLEKCGLRVSTKDPCLFYGKDLIVLSYVDDCLFFAKDDSTIDKFLKKLKSFGKLKLTVESDVYAFLGIEMSKSDSGAGITMTQKGLIEKVLRTTKMTDCNSKATPASTIPLGTNTDGEGFKEEWEYPSVIGMLLYLSSNSRPDIQFAVHQCARFCHNPRH